MTGTPPSREADGLRAAHDRFEIADLLARYCEHLDEYDIDGVAETFTEDVVTDYGPGRGGPVAGRRAVADRIARGQAAFRRTHHQLGQSRLELEGDEARGVTYVTAWHERFDGTRDTLYLRYVDRFRRTADGWRIAERIVLVDGAVGFEGVAWVWAPRRAPAPAGD